MSRCYNKFIEEQGEQWKEILELFDLAEITKAPNQTILQCGQMLQKIRKKIIHIVSYFASGIQIAIDFSCSWTPLLRSMDSRQHL